MRSVVFTVEQLSVERQRARVAATMLAARTAIVREGGQSCREVERVTVDGFPVATGQSQEKVHLLPVEIVQLGEFERIRQGVGIGACPNGQEVRMEVGLVRVHRTMEEHDPKGRKCSTGSQGGWPSDDEPENVREQYGSLRANANATPSPLARAIVQVWGSVVDVGARFGFRKGKKNVYPGAGMVLGNNSLLVRLRAAVRQVL